MNNATDWWSTFRAYVMARGANSRVLVSDQQLREGAADFATAVHGKLNADVHIVAFTPHGNVQFCGVTDAVVFASTAFQAGMRAAIDTELMAKSNREKMT